MSNYLKRFLSLAVALVMVIGMVPGTAFATEEDSTIVVTETDELSDAVEFTDAAIEVTDAEGNVTYYAGFEGFSALNLENCTIKLLADVSDANLILNKDDTGVVLDLNGFTFSREGSTSGAINLTLGAELIIKDSSEAKTGKILGDNNAIWIMNGSVVVEGGTIETTTSTVATVYANAAELTIEGGKIVAAGDAVLVGDNFMESRGTSTVIVSGGEIEAAGNGIVSGSYSQAATAVSVSGGKIDAVGDSIKVTTGTVAVSGGEFSSLKDEYVHNGATVTVAGKEMIKTENGLEEVPAAPAVVLNAQTVAGTIKFEPVNGDNIAYVLDRLEISSNLFLLAGGIKIVEIEVNSDVVETENVTIKYNTVIEGEGSVSGTIVVAEGAVLTIKDTVGIENAVIVDENGNAIQGVNGVYTPAKLQGEGTEADPYTIGSLEELKLFRDKVNAGNTYKNVYIQLTADIDLAGETWTPIGNEEAPFKGNFDGNGKTISNLVVDVDTNNAGLFGFASVIKNLTVNNATVSGVISVGALVGELESSVGTVDNCQVTGLIQITGENSVGGLVGKGYANIKNSSVVGADGSFVLGKANGTEEGDNVGGIIGHLGEGNTLGVTNVTVKNITVKGTRKVGGVLGTTARANDNIGCTVENVTVECTADAAYADANAATTTIGGIVGNYFGSATSGGVLKDCSVKDLTLVAGNAKSAGALVGGDRENNGGAPVGVDTVSGNTASGVTGATNTYFSVAKVGETSYASLQEAIDAAQAGETVTLLDDIVLTEGVVIATDDVITLDLNSKTISQTQAQTAAYSMIDNKGSLTIKDSASGGKISYTDTATYSADNGYVSNTIINSGKLTIESGRIENLSAPNVASYGYPQAIDNDGALIVNGGEVYCDNYSAIRIWCTTDDNTSVVINGGTITGAVDLQNVNGSANKGSLTVNGGTFNKGNGTGNGSLMSLRLVNFGTDVDELSMDITGGTFKGGIAMSGTQKDNALLVKVVEISGGTYTVAPSNDLLAPGYEVTYNNINGTFGVEATVVAIVEGKTYTSLAEAIEAAQGGKTVYLQTSVTIASGETLNLNNVKLSAVNGATVTNNGTIYLNGADMDSTITITGNGAIKAASGTNNIDGSTIKIKTFQVGTGKEDANVAPTADVVVNVKNGAVLTVGGSAYDGWVGSKYGAEISNVRYILNIDKSAVSYGYLHVSKDGVLNVTGSVADADKLHMASSYQTFYVGDFIVNGVATLDNVDARVQYGKVSVDNKDTTNPGTLNIVNGAKVAFAAEGNSNTALKWWNSGVVNVEDATVSARTPSITETGKLNITNATFTTDNTITNAGSIHVSGTSDIAAAKVTGAGWVYMHGANLDADTKLIGAKVRFASGTNNVDGATIDDGYFQVGIGAYNGVDANVDTENGVVVNVKNAKIGANGDTYAGWVGTGFYDTDAEKTAAMTDAKYVLNIENSVAEFGYLHVSNDGELNVKGNAAEKAWYNNSDYSFYAGDFIINGTATFDATDVLALYTKVSCDNGTDKPGTVNMVNGAEYEAERHNGAISGTNFVLYKTGVANVEEGAKLHIGEYTTIAADAVMNIGGDVTALGTITNNGTINLTSVNAALVTPEAPEVNAAVEGYTATYVDGAYKLIERQVTGEIAYRAYIEDSASREAIKVDLQNIYAKESVVVKLYDANGNLLTTTTLKAGAAEGEYLTTNIVLSGTPSGSWDTVISADKLTVANVPTKGELYIDGNLKDTFDNILGKSTDAAAYQLPAYLALDCVYKEAKIGDTYYLTLADALAVAQNGETVTLLADAELATTTNIKKTITIDGNGHKITQTADFAGNASNALLDISGGAKVTFENLTFDAIKNVAIMRTVDASIVMDNCVVQNCEHTAAQGLLRLAGDDATIKNSKFLNNDCTMVITFSYDKTDYVEKLTIENCEFTGNSCNGTAVIYFANGGGAAITSTSFINNTVTSTSNVATIYFGDAGNDYEVSGCTFKGNDVSTSAGWVTKIASAIYCNGGTVNGNVFDSNTATRAGTPISNVVYVTTSAWNKDGKTDLGENYWDGKAPVPGVDYTVDSTNNHTVTVADYYASYDAVNGLDDLTAITYVAKIGNYSYTTLDDAFAAAKDGDTVTIFAGEYTTNVAVNKAITVVGETDAEGNNLVKINGGISITADGATVKNLTASNPATTGYNMTLGISAGNVLVEGCVITDRNATRFASATGTVTIKDSIITGEVYGLHFDGTTGGNIVIEGCTITGWTSFASSITEVTITDTTFADGNYNLLRFYQDATVTNCTFPSGNCADYAGSGMRIDAGNNGAGMNVQLNFNGCKTADGTDLAGAFDDDMLESTGVYIDGVRLMPICAEVNGTQYCDLQAAIDEAEAGDTVTVLADITLTETVTVAADKTVTLDLNGKTIDFDPEVWVYGAANSGTALLTVAFGGDLTIEDTSAEQTGTIDGSANVNDVYGAVMMTVKGDNAENGTAKLTVNGGTLIGGYAAIAGNKDRDNTEIVINGGVIKTGISDSYSTAGIEHPMNGKLTINGGTIKGMDGISFRSGELRITGGTIIGTAPTTAFEDDGYWDNDFGTCTGHALQIVSRANSNSANETPSVTIIGGTFTSANAAAVGSYAGYKGETPDTQIIGFISGGTFSSDVSELCIDGYKATDADGDGTYNITVALPEVEITDIKNTLTDNDPDLTFALNFAIKDIENLTEDYINDLMEAYGSYYTDYVLTISGLSQDTVTFNANGNADGYLAGQYDAWSTSWVSVPFEDVEIQNGESLYIMEYAAKLMGQSGLRFTLAEVAAIVQNFDCGVYFTPEFLAANPNMKVTLELKVFTEDAEGNKIDDISVATNEFDTQSIVAMVTAEGKQTIYAQTLAEAVAAAEDGDTITVLADITLTETVTIPAGKTVTLDLAGYTISGTCNANQGLILVNNTAKLTIKDSSDPSTGKITYASGASNVGCALDVKGNLILESGTIEMTGNWNNGFAVDVRPNSWGTEYTESTTFVMNGGKIVSSDSAVRVASSSVASHKNVSASFTMNGGVIESDWDAIFIQHWVACDLTVEINDGAISGDNSALRIYGDTAVNNIDLTVSGGSFDGDIKNLGVTGEGKTEITGGTFDSDVSDYCAEGYICEANGDGTYTVVEAVAKIGDTGYATLQEAVNAAQDTENVVTLLKGGEIAVATAPVTVNKNGFEATVAAGKGYTVTEDDTSYKVVEASSVGGDTTVEVPGEGAAVAYIDLNSNGSYDSATETLQSLKAALNAATSGQTVRLIQNLDLTVEGVDGTVIIPTGVTLDIQSFTLTAKYVIGLADSKLSATTIKTSGEGGRLVIPQQNLILDEDPAINASDGAKITPTWDTSKGNYLFAKFALSTTLSNQGLQFRTNADGQEELYFQFSHTTTNLVNTTMLNNGGTDNALTVVVRLEWTVGENTAVAYQDFVYKDEFVASVAAGGQNFALTIRGYEALGITQDNVTVTAMILTESGLIVEGTPCSN